MRRIMLLVLLALALPMPALANSSFNFSIPFSPPNPVGFVIGRVKGSFTTTITASVTGFQIGVTPARVITISITTGTLSPSSNCAPGFKCFVWTSDGSLTVSHKASALFTDKLNEQFGIVTLGPVAGFPESVLSISGFLSPNIGPNTRVTGNALISFPFTGFHATLINGSAGVSGTFATPEPGTLEGLLLGTGVIGLIGLPGLARRKLNLGT